MIFFRADLCSLLGGFDYSHFRLGIMIADGATPTRLHPKYGRTKVGRTTG